MSNSPNYLLQVTVAIGHLDPGLPQPTSRDLDSQNRQRIAIDFLARKLRKIGIIGCMTYPRAHLVDQANGGHYHCISRCVRQSWLCGVDHKTGKSFEHRRSWIAERVEHLTTVFAVDIFAYAVMSNHYHLVLKLDPKRTDQWSDKEVAQRWLNRNGTNSDNLVATEHVENLVKQSGRISQLRDRLGSISWFMRHINEPLARKANAEDKCKGRFWEGRFKSVALLDHTALLACMVYVDLNPVRANPRVKLPSPHTSAKQREHRQQNFLVAPETLGTTTSQYLNLLAWSKPETQRDSKISNSIGQFFVHNPRDPQKTWLQWVASFSKGYRAYGSKNALSGYAKRLGQSWLRNPLMRSAESDGSFALNLVIPSA